MSSFCFYNGSFIEKKELLLSVDDLGFSRGYALFEHCRTYFGLPFHFKEHLLRLSHGARDLLLFLPYSFDEISEIVNILSQKNGFEESGFKLYLTPGPAKEGLTPAGKETFIIYPYLLAVYQGLYPKKGLSLKTTSLQRALPRYKTSFYLPGMLAKKQHPHYDDILFLDPSNALLESTTAAFLAFKQDTLIIPEGDLLQSVTQEILLQLARPLFKIEKRPIYYEEISSLTEAFLSSSTRELYPIETIDNIRLGGISSYKNTLKLKKIFEEYLQKKDWPLLESFKDYLPANSLR